VLKVATKSRGSAEKYISALRKMYSYENQVYIENEFSDQLMIQSFEANLKEYADIMENSPENSNGEWTDFKNYVKSGDITWADSNCYYVVILEGTTNIDVISQISNSQHYSYIDINMENLTEKNLERLFLDGMWKLYRQKNFTYRKSLEIFLRHNPRVFREITITTIEKFIIELEYFNEKEILLWLKLQ